NDDYVIYGGEFLRVNNVRQQGLVRFPRRSIADTHGPWLKTTAWPLAVSSRTRGTVRLSWQGNYDRDDATLTYSLYRDSVNNPPLHVETVTAPFWKQPRMSFVDTGLVPGSTPRYRVIARDPAGNQAV